MRSIAFLAVFLACASLLADGAAAKTKLTVKTKTYSISGNTGLALIGAMDRKGPRHGFTTRAIAQTGYAVGWEFTWERSGTACRLAAANGTLDMTYTFPKATGPMPPALQRRWDRFMAGVRKHEETHGATARAMVAAAEKSITGLRSPRDPSCRSVVAQVKRRIDATYAEYEARQVAFDKREHRSGGNVEKLLIALGGKA